MYNIVMFAYNEADNLSSSIVNMHNNIDKRAQSVYLLANGCTDDTVKVAHRLKNELNFTQLEVVEIKLGDKCNAWNYYIHQLNASAKCHFFVDADVIFSDNCFPILYDELLASQYNPHIVAGYPLSGRNLDFYKWLIEERSCFFGNLYGASHAYIEMIRNKQFYMPIGLNWIDSFLTKAANTDIEFFDTNLPNRVIYKKGVGFEFESLSPFKISDIKLYKNRIARYELGKIQELYLDELDANEWPRNMDSINQDIFANFESKSNHLGPVKKWLVKRRLKRILTKSSNTHTS